MQIQDYSTNFFSISKDVVNSAGVFYTSFRKGLKPKLWMVWKDISIGYFFILANSTCLLFLTFDSTFVSILMALFGSIIYGYFHHYLALFFHEASHRNIAKDKKLNDLLANLFIGFYKVTISKLTESPIMHTILN